MLYKYLYRVMRMPSSPFLCSWFQIQICIELGYTVSYCFVYEFNAWDYSLLSSLSHIITG